MIARFNRGHKVRCHNGLVEILEAVFSDARRQLICQRLASPRWHRDNSLAAEMLRNQSTAEVHLHEAMRNGKDQIVKSIRKSKTACFAALFCAAMAISSRAQTFTTLASFDNKNGSFSQAPLVQGLDGNLYGTTDDGGLKASGTAFKITLAGGLTLVHYFCSRTNCADGEVPESGLVPAANGDLYGITSSGGSGCSDCGTVFQITSRGTLFTLHSFDGSDGLNPLGLMQASNGDFYGTTSTGGSGSGGTIFRMTPTGILTTLYNFEDFNYPVAGLVEGTDRNFYGTAITYASDGHGMIFKMTADGAVTTLRSFGGADGSWPVAPLMEASNGHFYGTTAQGGPASSICVSTGCGTVFEITPEGVLTTLHYFAGPDGLSPSGALVQGTDGNLYGTTSSGGPANSSCHFGCGTIFRITPEGKFTTLHTFDGLDGQYPYVALVQATDGNFYGTTYAGGTSTACTEGCGTVFRLSMGLKPFVETVPTANCPRRSVKILGTDLTGATSVTFNGVEATFTVVSPTEITTAVPAGATTGEVKVVTPRGTLSTDVPFRVF
jgi:uncharacterized repeat protein (TIGR03803 family)